MRTLLFLLLIFFISGGCKKDKEDFFISAQIDGRAWRTENIQVQKDPATGALISFSGKAGNETIGIKLQFTNPPYEPGSYFFREANMNPAFLVSFIAVTDNFRARLRWSTSIETGLQSFIVERSETGQNFSPIKTIAATNTSNLTQYEYLDPEYFSNQRYYRLKMVETDGSFNYSTVLAFNVRHYSAFLEDANGKYNGMNGTINIVSHDRSKKILSGNYQFSVNNYSGQTITITNGSFRIGY